MIHCPCPSLYIRCQSYESGRSSHQDVCRHSNTRVLRVQLGDTRTKLAKVMDLTRGLRLCNQAVGNQIALDVS